MPQRDVSACPVILLSAHGWKPFSQKTGDPHLFENTSVGQDGLLAGEVMRGDESGQNRH